MGYSVDRATRADISDLAEQRVAFQSAQGVDVGDGSLMHDQVKDYLDQELDRAAVAFLARDEETGKVVASAFLIVVHRLPGGRHGNGLMGMVLNVYTEPAHRRHGLATRLMVLLVDTARELGVARIELAATADGLPLYQQLGFTVEQTTDVPMELDLRSRPGSGLGAPGRLGRREPGRERTDEA